MTQRQQGLPPKARKRQTMAQPRGAPPRSSHTSPTRNVYSSNLPECRKERFNTIGPFLRERLPCFSRIWRQRACAPLGAEANMFEIFKEFTFEAAHHLAVNVADGHPYARLHGHSFRVELFLKGEKDQDKHWLCDFGEI